MNLNNKYCPNYKGQLNKVNFEMMKLNFEIVNLNFEIEKLNFDIFGGMVLKSY